MAKGYRKNVIAVPNESVGAGSNGNRVREIELSTGKKVRIIGVSHLYFMEVKNSVKFPEPPTYEAQTAGTAVESHVIDQTVVDDPTNTPEEKEEYAAKLAKYEMDFQAAQALQTERINNFLLVKGVEVDIPESEMIDWIQERELLGLEVSDKPQERKLQYIGSRVVGGLGDYAALINAVMESTGVSEDKLVEAKKLFRDFMETSKTTA